MSAFSRTSTRIAIGALIATGFAVAVAAPINAHTGELFTVADLGSGPAGVRFATISGSDASVTSLAGGPSTTRFSSGVEIADEVAYAILGNDDDDNDDGPIQLEVWDHNTGAVLNTLDVTLNFPGAAFLLDAYALDTSPSGSLLAFGDLQIGNGEFPTFTSWVLEIDPATGIATPIIDLAGLEPAPNIDLNLFLDSIATDPTTDITYIFYDYNQNDQYVATLNLSAGTYGTGEILTEIVSDLGLGFVSGADFDTAGTLWFYYATDDGGVDIPSIGGLASTAGAFSSAVGAVPSGVVESPSQNLAYDPYVAPVPVPVLASTGNGLPVIGISLIAFAIAAVGGALLFLKAKRRTA